MTENEAKNFHVNTDMFGQYAKIPTGRSGDLHIYKIITRFRSNGYCDTPIIFGKSTLHEEVTDVLNVIHCGIDESKVIRVALKDCEIIENEEAKELRKYRKIGSVEECREAVEKQIPKKPVCKPKPYNKSVGFNEEWVCPSCGAYIGYFYEGMDEPEQMEHCNECGQHIAGDWSDENEDE